MIHAICVIESTADIRSVIEYSLQENELQDSLTDFN